MMITETKDKKVLVSPMSIYECLGCWNDSAEERVRSYQTLLEKIWLGERAVYT